MMYSPAILSVSKYVIYRNAMQLILVRPSIMTVQRHSKRLSSVNTSNCETVLSPSPFRSSSVAGIAAAEEISVRLVRKDQSNKK